MSEPRLYLATGVPMLFNALLITVLIPYMNARFTALGAAVNERLDAVNQRFDDMRDLGMRQAIEDLYQQVAEIKRKIGQQ